jgi:hypothetical protein
MKRENLSFQIPILHVYLQRRGGLASWRHRQQRPAIPKADPCSCRRQPGLRDHPRRTAGAMAFREVEAKMPAPSGKPCYRCCRKKPLMLITINSATWYSVMPPHRATLCRRRFDRRPKLTRVSSAPEAFAGNSNLLKSLFFGSHMSRLSEMATSRPSDENGV